MRNEGERWDYLIITAANERQAAAYDSQIRIRRELGRWSAVHDVLVVADASGRRAGSGGSTIQCLREVLRREGLDDGAEAVLRRLRVLILHAGGDSRRLPAYSPCGKIFVPLPGDSPGALPPTLFDRLVDSFLGLPSGARDAGQIVIAAGDALILFDSSEVDFTRAGITALGAGAPPEEAMRHGVFCANSGGTVRLYLQKPDIGEQAKAGAIGEDGRSVLDIGVMSFDARAGAQLLRAFDSTAAQAAMVSHGIDLYREICCALGTETTFSNYLASARGSGSQVEESVLAGLFDRLRSIPLSVQTLRQCGFLHFGSTRQLISSGIELVARDQGFAPMRTVLAITNDVADGVLIVGAKAWVEGCRVRAPLTLRGRNVIVGADVLEPFELPEGACLDVSPGAGYKGENVWFVRYYGVDDTFKHSMAEGATYCGGPLADWLSHMDAPVSEIWAGAMPEGERTLWNARIFPAEKEAAAYPKWRWMLDPANATREQKGEFLAADRYSSAEIALRVDQAAFHARRAAICASAIERAGLHLAER